MNYYRIIVTALTLTLASCNDTSEQTDNAIKAGDSLAVKSKQSKDYESMTHGLYYEKLMLDTQLVLGLTKNDVKNNKYYAILIRKYDSLQGYLCDYFHSGAVSKNKLKSKETFSARGFRWKISDSSYHALVGNIEKPISHLIKDDLPLSMGEVPYSMYIDNELYISKNINDKDFKKLFKYLNDSLIDRHIKYW